MAGEKWRAPVAPMPRRPWARWLGPRVRRPQRPGWAGLHQSGGSGDVLSANCFERLNCLKVSRSVEGDKMNKQITRMNEINARTNQQRANFQRWVEGNARVRRTNEADLNRVRQAHDQRHKDSLRKGKNVLVPSDNRSAGSLLAVILIVLFVFFAFFAFFAFVSTLNRSPFG
jgi:hypothetical protein